MSMGYSGTELVTIKKEEVQKLEIRSYQKFLDTLEEEDVTIKNFAIAMQYEDVLLNNEGEEVDQEIFDSVYTAYKLFEEEFEDSTGIAINIIYHDKESQGSTYDSIDGVFYELNFGDVYEMTSNAKALKEKVDFNFSSFVTFG